MSGIFGRALTLALPLALGLALSGLSACSSHGGADDSVTPIAECTSGPTVELEPPISLSKKLVRTMGGYVVPSVDCDAITQRSQGLHIRTGSIDGEPFKTNVADAFFPSLPLFEADAGGSVTAVLSQAKIVHVDRRGTASDFFVFPDPPSSYLTGLTQGAVAVSELSGSVARGLQLSVVAKSEDEVYVANSVTGEVNKLDGTGTASTLATGLVGVHGLALRRDGTLLAALPARFDHASPANLIAPPSIVSIAADGTVTPFFEFPSSGYNYRTSSSRAISGSETMYVGFDAELAVDKQDNLYVTLNTAGALFKIDATGKGKVVRSDLQAPIGIAVDRAGTLIVALAPLLDRGSHLMSGIKVVAIAPDMTQRTLYSGPMKAVYQSDFVGDIANSTNLYPVDASAHLNLDQRGNLYLQDSLASEILFFRRPG